MKSIWPVERPACTPLSLYYFRREYATSGIDATPQRHATPIRPHAEISHDYPREPIYATFSEFPRLPNISRILPHDDYFAAGLPMISAAATVKKLTDFEPLARLPRRHSIARGIFLPR